MSRRWIELVLGHPKAVLLIFGLLTLALGQGLRTLPVDTDVTRDLPPSLPAKQLYDRIDQLFPSKEFIVVGVEADDLFSAAALSDLDRLTRALDALPLVQAAVGPTTVKVIRGTESEAGLGVDIRALAERPPSSAAEAEAIRRALYEGPGHEDFVGSLVSVDGKAAAILVSLKAFLDEGGGRSTSLREAEVAAGVLETVQAFRGSLRVHPVGRPVAAYYSKKMMGKDIKILSMAALLVIMVLLFASFRSLRGVLLPIGVVTGAVVWTLGLMGTLGIPLTHSTEVMPILLIAIGVADGIHLLKFYASRAARGGERVDIVREVLRDLFAPVVMTSLTTMAGFLSLLSSGVPSIAVLGIFTSFGVLAAMVFSLSVLPAALVLLPIPKRLRQAPAAAEAGGLLSERVARRYGLWLVAHKGVAALIVVGLGGASLWGATRVRAEMSTLDNYKPEHPFRRDVEAVNRSFAGTSTLMIVVEGPPGTLREPAVLRAVDDLEGFLRRTPHVGSTRSLAGTIKQLHRAMFQGDEARYRIPADEEEVDGLELVTVDGEEQVQTVRRRVAGRAVMGDLLMALESSARPADFANAVNLDFSAAKVTAFLDSDRASVADEVHAQVAGFVAQRFGPLQQRFPGLKVELTGMLELVRAVNHMVVRGQLVSLGTSLLLVLVLNALLFRSLLLGLLATLPLSICIFFNFGFMGLADFPLNLMTMVTANIAIGVGVDYAIHYVHRHRAKLAELGDPAAATVAALVDSGVAVFLNAVTVALGFACLVFSSYGGVMQMGALLALTTLAAAFAALIVLPLIFASARRAR